MSAAGVIMCLAVVSTSITPFSGSGIALAGDDDKRSEAAQRMQEQAREQQKQAEEQRRDAERAAKRAAEDARKQQFEAQSRQREAAKQAEEARRASASAAKPSSRSADPVAQQRPSAASPTAPKENASAASTKTVTQGTERNVENSASNNKNDAGKKTDDGEDRDDDRKQNKPSDHRTQTAVDEPPPATVEQWLKKLVTPPAAEHGPQTAPKAAGNAATPVTPVKQHPVRRPDPIAIPTFGPEVLALNASRQTLEAAKALGFKSAPGTTLSSLNFNVARLLPPDGMNAADAQRLLRKEIPQSHFALNNKYRIYKAAAETGSRPAAPRATAGSVPVGSVATCTVDRCFGRDAIGWRPDLQACAAGIRVGIIDTSVDVSHPAFARHKPEVKHLGNGGKPGPDWHGTGVTALLAGDANGGTPGLIPSAQFFVADIFTADTDNEPASDTLSMLRAFDWLESKNVKIINMSLSGPADDLIRQAVEKLSSKGILFVAAAGNAGPGAEPSYPAAYEPVIAVTAVNKNLQSYRYANHGSYIDVAAPGVSIWTALPGAMEGYHSGTSFATPYVTASLAALYPQLTAKTPAAALRQLTYKDLGAPGPDRVYGQGLVVAPSSCGNNQIARTPRGSSSEAAAVAPTGTGSSKPAETLPWLSFQSGN